MPSRAKDRRSRKEDSISPSASVSPKDSGDFSVAKSKKSKKAKRRNTVLNSSGNLVLLSGDSSEESMNEEMDVSEQADKSRCQKRTAVASPEQVRRKSRRPFESEDEVGDLSAEQLTANMELENLEEVMEPGSAKTAEDILEEGSLILATLRSYLTQSSRRVPSGIVNHVMTTVCKLKSMLDDAVVKSVRLETEVDVLRGDISARQDRLEKEMRSISTAVRAPAPGPSSVPAASPLSYAQRARIGLKSIESSRVRPPGNVVVIYPNDDKLDEFDNSEKTKAKVREIINPAIANIGVRGVRRVRGSGILVETVSRRDLSTFKESAALRGAGFRVEEPNVRKPRMLLYDVPREISDEELIALLQSQNFADVDQESLRKSVRIAFRMGKREAPVVNLVLEVDSTMRDRMLDRGRIYLGWSSCKVQDFLGVSRCYNCQRYGHVAKFCRSPESCGHCGDVGHGREKCPKLDNTPTCANCKRSGKGSNHSVTDKACGSRTMALEEAANRTDYGAR